jgi:anti-sigma B factor antagonist
MSIKIREVSTVNVLDIEGKIDINSSDIVETVGWLVNTGKVNILLNLAGVDSVDYNGLSILAIAYKNVVNHQGKIRFMCVALPVLELFKVVKLDSVFDVYPDEKSAIDSFSGESPDNLHHLRRKFKRLDLHLTATYSITGSQKKPQRFEGIVLNLSAAGIYLYTHSIFPLNSVLDIALHLPGGAGDLEAQGRVVYLADKEMQPHAFPGMGVAFLHLNAEKEKVVIDFIDKNITQRSEPS